MSGRSSRLRKRTSSTPTRSHFEDRPEPQIVVEYAAGDGGKHASEAQARKAVAPYLDQEDLPRRLFVDREGNIRVRDD